MTEIKQLLDWIRTDARERGIAGVSIRKPLGSTIDLQGSLPQAEIAARSDIVSFYSCCDGLALGYWSICSQREVIEWDSPNLFMIHNWGNGDADAIDVSAEALGRIVFCGHDPVYRFAVAPCLSSYVFAAYLEFRDRGDEALMHPFDSWQSGVKGLYRPPTDYPGGDG